MGIKVIATVLPVKKRTCKMELLEKQNTDGISGKSSIAFDDNFTAETIMQKFSFFPHSELKS